MWGAVVRAFHAGIAKLDRAGRLLGAVLPCWFRRIAGEVAIEG